MESEQHVPPSQDLIQEYQVHHDLQRSKPDYRRLISNGTIGEIGAIRTEQNPAIGGVERIDVRGDHVVDLADHATFLGATKVALEKLRMLAS